MQLNDEKKKEYLQEVKKEMPKTKHFSTMLKAFVTGGIICSIGQSITYIINLISPDLDEQTVGGFTTLVMILITCILTGFGIYDKIGSFGGAGSIIPITGFANSIVSPAIEHKKEGIVLGLCTNMFSIAGPVIVFGITASILVGIIYLFV
ncbi:MAG: stage V sporulation protein AC [Clostridia bacterium]|nr:stage V sporulation protein AC [Clostridia bacterium]